MDYRGLIVACVLALSSCGGGSGGSSESTGGGNQPSVVDNSYLQPATAGSRKWLTHDELHSLNAEQPNPYHNSHFMPVETEQPAIHQLSKRITIASGRIIGFPTQFDDNAKANIFPQITFDVLSHKGYLVPVQRDIIVPAAAEKQWRVILSPGKVWSEASDNGMSRASMPLVLVDRSWNNALNGLATFLYDDAGVSNLRVQFVQHTSAGYLHEGAAMLELSAENYTGDSNQVLASFDLELAQLLPVKSWEELKNNHPNIDFSTFNHTINDTQISATGLWFDGAIYVQSCATEYGDYPFCQFMRHGIYSATKSAAGAMGLAFLAQRYGKEVLNYKLIDYLDIDAPHDGWRDVEFIDLINMSAGIGNNDDDPLSPATHADENTEPMGAWTRANTAARKIEIATEQYANYPWLPGEVFRYNTTHTFLLSAAMDALVKQKGEAGLWPLMLKEVYQPAGISHLPMMHSTEFDGSAGVPIMGIGLYPTIDEAVKLGLLFHQLGKVGDNQILDADVVSNMLYRTAETGFVADYYTNQHGRGRYHMSFWGAPFTATDCGQFVPFMSGYGGNLIGVLNNGTVVFRFTDAQVDHPLSMVEVASQLADMCPAN